MGSCTPHQLPWRSLWRSTARLQVVFSAVGACWLFAALLEFDYDSDAVRTNESNFSELSRCFCYLIAVRKDVPCFALASSAPSESHLNA